MLAIGIFLSKNVSAHKWYFIKPLTHSDTFILADLFENFPKKCFEAFELDPARFLSVLRGRICTQYVNKKMQIINI